MYTDTIASLYAEAIARANGMSNALLDKLVDRLCGRQALTACDKHAIQHVYVLYKRIANVEGCNAYYLTKYEEVRNKYKSLPCTCWVRRR